MCRPAMQHFVQNVASAKIGALKKDIGISTNVFYFYGINTIFR
jgi:hypothetical protein